MNTDFIKVCIILEHTKDGDELTSFELKIVEMAVNGILNKAGHDEFNKIYNKYTSKNDQSFYSTALYFYYSIGRQK